MINNLIHNLRNSKHFRGTAAEKRSVFFASTRLHLKSRLSRKKNTAVSESLLNYKVSAYDYSTMNFLFQEVFISDEYYFQPLAVAPLIIDCGANIGMSVLYFKKLFPLSTIIAFEANPHAFKLLEKNVSDNKISKVELHNLALFDKETEISFFIGDNISTLGGSINKGRGGFTELKVPAKKLSDYLKQLKTIDLIKMDVEGAELNIINDLVESFTINKVKEYIIEYHHNMEGNRSTLSSFLEKFESNGFKYNIKASYSKINSPQDLLIHFYK